MHGRIDSMSSSSRCVELFRALQQDSTLSSPKIPLSVRQISRDVRSTVNLKSDLQLLYDYLCRRGGFVQLDNLIPSTCRSFHATSSNA
jgi:hypothetical protein